MNGLLAAIANGLEPTALSLGFSRKGKLFWRERDGVAVVARLQGSMNSSTAVLKFTTNLEMYVLALLDQPWTKSDPHWVERVGFVMPEMDDVWWTVQLESIDLEVATQQAIFEQWINPTFEKNGNIGFIAETWKTGSSGFVTPLKRAKFLDTARKAGIV